jgi:competence protein ComEA
MDSAPREKRLSAPRVAGVAMVLALCGWTAWLAIERPAHDTPIEAVDKAARLIDVNRASAAELDLLPRIGPTLAQRIIATRESEGSFASLDDLQRVKGIGPRTVERLRCVATARP